MNEHSWSATKISTWRACPRQFDQRYNQPRSPEGLRLPGSSTAKRMGIVAHAGMQAAYEAAAYAPGFHHTQTMERFVGEAVVAVRRHSDLAPTLLTDTEGAQVECEVVEALMALPAPHPTSVLGVEHELTGFSPAGRALEGRIDLILRTGPYSLHIRDWKRTSLANLPSADELASGDQLPFYRYLVGLHYPWVRRVTIGLYSLTSRAEVSAEIDGPRAWEALRACDVLAEQAEQATSFPPRPHPDHCPRCPARGDCPVWRPFPGA